MKHLLLISLTTLLFNCINNPEPNHSEPHCSNETNEEVFPYGLDLSLYQNAFLWDDLQYESNIDEIRFKTSFNSLDKRMFAYYFTVSYIENASGLSKTLNLDSWDETKLCYSASKEIVAVLKTCLEDFFDYHKGTPLAFIINIEYYN